jgi:hypothetical protein
MIQKVCEKLFSPPESSLRKERSDEEGIDYRSRTGRTDGGL